MAENSSIEWTDHTFNPWVGCTKVSPACDHCYAEAWAKRTGSADLWSGNRRRTRPANWRKPLKWNADHDRFFAEHGRRQRVFCASLADVFDNEIDPAWRPELWELIASTRNLDWLLLTKRIGNAKSMLPVMDSRQPGYRPWHERWPWRNVWIGATVINQAEADRDIPKLLDVPAAVRFLSIEPLLGPIDLQRYIVSQAYGMHPNGINLHPFWVIVGGESGPNARPMHPIWARSIRDQCATANIPFLFKQWGEWGPYRARAGGNLGREVRRGRVVTVHPTGESDITVFERTGRNTIPGSRYMARAGKKQTGRELDGRIHDGFPLPA